MAKGQDDKPIDGSQPSNLGGNGNNDSDNLATINKTLVSFVEIYKDTNEKDPNRDLARFRIESAVAAGVILYTLLTAGIFIASLSQVNALWSQVRDGHKEVATALDSEHRQLRAYMFLEGTKVVINPDRSVHSNIVFKNYGTTPAENVRYWACVTVRDVIIKDHALVDPIDLPEWRGDILALSSTAVPQGTPLPVYLRRKYFDTTHYYRSRTSSN
jgi:hypothetical protein